MKTFPTDLEDQSIRRLYDEATDTWWFSVVDVVQVLTQQADFQTARKDWNQLKRRLAAEGSQSVTGCHQFKMPAADGKSCLTDCATAETLLRLVQSIPKAEPIKLWLARAAYERMQEIADPAQALDRARQTWQQQGRSSPWVQQRMAGQETHNKLTDYWSEHGIEKGREIAILSNLIHQEWSGLSVAEHKEAKGLSSHNLRDHMSEAELIFTALAELSTRQIAESRDATGMADNITAAKAGGRIARNARQQLEDQTGQSVVTAANRLPPGARPLGKLAVTSLKPRSCRSRKKP